MRYLYVSLAVLALLPAAALASTVDWTFTSSAMAYDSHPDPITGSFEMVNADYYFSLADWNFTVIGGCFDKDCTQPLGSFTFTSANSYVTPGDLGSGVVYGLWFREDEPAFPYFSTAFGFDGGLTDAGGPVSLAMDWRISWDGFPGWFQETLPGSSGGSAYDEGIDFGSLYGSPAGSSSVPEPSSLVLLGTSLLSLAAIPGLKKKRRC